MFVMVIIRTNNDDRVVEDRDALTRGISMGRRGVAAGVARKPELGDELARRSGSSKKVC